jgi:hypothetical protein
MLENSIKYATFYAVEPEITEIKPIYMTWKVGKCSAGTVYLCLDREDEARAAVERCDLCFPDLDTFFSAFPECEGKEESGNVDKDGKPILKNIISRITVC